MKIYQAPASINVPKFEFTKGIQDYENRFKNYVKEVKKEAINCGFEGNLTGKIVEFSVCDGHAKYMIIQKGSSISLIHLDYLDGYNSNLYVSKLTKRELLIHFDFQKKLNECFDKGLPKT
jgi:hypothetical protein